MEEQSLSQALKEAVLKGLELAEKTGEFVIEQAPDLVQQFIMWHTAQHIFISIIGIMIPIICILVFFSLGKKTNGHPGRFEIKLFGRIYEEFAGILMTIILFCLPIVAGTITFYIGVYNLIFILVAPKIYIIEYFIDKM